MNKSNIFSITSFQTSAHLTGISVDFTAPFNLNKTSNSIVPAYCRDKLFFTPAFILPRQKQYYNSNTSFQKLCFQQRKQKAQKLISDSNHNNKPSVSNLQNLNIFKPNSNYCQICKKTFQVYNDHVYEETHVKGIQISQANIYINQLCQQYVKIGKQINEKNKRKLINKQNKTTFPSNKNNKIRCINQKIIKDN